MIKVWYRFIPLKCRPFSRPSISQQLVLEVGFTHCRDQEPEQKPTVKCRTFERLAPKKESPTHPLNICENSTTEQRNVLTLGSQGLQRHGSSCVTHQAQHCALQGPGFRGFGKGHVVRPLQRLPRTQQGNSIGLGHVGSRWVNVQATTKCFHDVPGCSMRVWGKIDELYKLVRLFL
jgi:hypothetical protein